MLFDKHGFLAPSRTRLSISALGGSISHGGGVDSHSLSPIAPAHAWRSSGNVAYMRELGQSAGFLCRSDSWLAGSTVLVGLSSWSLSWAAKRSNSSDVLTLLQGRYPTSVTLSKRMHLGTPPT